MSKFELPIYDVVTGEVAKTYKRNFMPVNLYIRFNQLAEKIGADKLKGDKDMFFALEELFRETFPELTSDEYRNQTDIAQVLLMFRDILDVSKQIESGNSKNG